MENNNTARLNKMALLPTPQATDFRTKRTSKSWKEKGATNASLGNPEFWEAHANEIAQARARINCEEHL